MQCIHGTILSQVSLMNCFRSIRALVLLLALAGTYAEAQQVDSTAVADSLLLRQLQQSMQPAPVNPAVQQAPAPPRSTLSTNPDLSAIGDFRSSYISQGKRKVDLYL